MGREHVNRALRQVVWPALKEHGFARRTSRTAWRDRDEQADVVNFQSFNAYNADGLGITTYSFQVNLGIHPLCRTTERTPAKNGALRPEEYECDFRRQPHKRLQQPECGNETLWFVRPDGSNLDAVVEDARDVVLSEGLEWFDQLEGVEALLRIAEHEPESTTGTWGMGAIGSPHRIELLESLRNAAASEARLR